MGLALNSKQQQDRDAVLESVQRLWRTKLKSVTALEKWLAKTSDFEIKAGLKAQLLDERRHLRILGEEVRRLGGRLSGSTLDQVLERPFALIQSQASDMEKLTAFHRGLKAFTVVRCGRLIPVVDAALARTLEQISRDEEGHIRWADIRLKRVRDLAEQRKLGFLMERMESTLNAVWSKTGRRLILVQPSRLFQR
jgi:rubrerythrin